MAFILFSLSYMSNHLNVNARTRFFIFLRLEWTTRKMSKWARPINNIVFPDNFQIIFFIGKYDIRENARIAHNSKYWFEWHAATECAMPKRIIFSMNSKENGFTRRIINSIWNNRYEWIIKHLNWYCFSFCACCALYTNSMRLVISISKNTIGQCWKYQQLSSA